MQRFLFRGSTKRIDNSNCRLVSQVDKETGKDEEAALICGSPVLLWHPCPLLRSQAVTTAT